MNKETTCAVVVTYNRKQLLLECLEALIKQTRSLEAIYIIDNASSDGTPELLKEKGYINRLPPEILSGHWATKSTIDAQMSPPVHKVSSSSDKLINPSLINIHYVRIHENTGGAGGFHEGVQRAYKKGYDWLWLLDDDAEPKEDALERSSEYFNDERLSALANLEVDKKGDILHHDRGYFNFSDVFKHVVRPIRGEEINSSKSIEIDHASFVGILISKKAIEEVGYPNKHFFIHYDDVEYCIRLRQIGKILLIRDSVICHKEQAREKNTEDKRNFLGRNSIRISYEKLWLSYYGTRNLTWLSKKYASNKLSFYFDILVAYFRSLLDIILFDNNKPKRVNFLTNAYLDGMKGIFDNDKPKRILYGNVSKSLQARS